VAVQFFSDSTPRICNSQRCGGTILTSSKQSDYVKLCYIRNTVVEPTALYIKQFADPLKIKILNSAIHFSSLHAVV
jgi:hypothetical protein